MSQQLRTRDDISAYFLDATKVRDLGRGSTNPSASDGITLATGDRFFRTDALIPVVYDGTRFLTAEIFEARFAYTTGISATVEDFTRLEPMPSGLQPYIVQWDVTFNIGATNTAVNYWQAFLRSNGTTTIAQTDTIGLTAATANQRRTITSFTQPAGALFYLNPSYVKQGTPSNLEALHIIRYRYIIP